MCTAEYFPSLINYNLTISWTIEDPLAREAVKDSVYRMEIIPEGPVSNPDLFKMESYNATVSMITVFLSIVMRVGAWSMPRVLLWRRFEYFNVMYMFM